MGDYTVKPLGPDTWDAFARLVERHNGIWGGCWCMYFHPEAVKAEWRGKAESWRPVKEWLVNNGSAHAALVFDGDEAVAWCQYGPPDELPNIHHRKHYEAGLTHAPPDYRLTCIFVDKAHRRKGVSAIALQGALDLIAAAGGGTVEGYPHDLQGKKISNSFLYNGTRDLYEQAGFTYERPKGQGNCVMTTTVAPRSPTRRARRR